MTVILNRKTIFDSVRNLLGRGFRQHEVAKLDDAIDASISLHQPSTSQQDRKSSSTYAVGHAGIALIKRFEGCARLRTDGLIEAYPDPASGGEPWTIGWGATGPDYLNDGPIGPGTIWTVEECNARFEQDLKRYADEVSDALAGAPTSQTQFDALVSFHYNTGSIGRATLTRKHNQGDFAGAQAEFARWNKAAGRVLKGLVKRRQAEAALYARG